MYTLHQPPPVGHVSSSVVPTVVAVCDTELSVIPELVDPEQRAGDTYRLYHVHRIMILDG